MKILTASLQAHYCDKGSFPLFATINKPSRCEYFQPMTILESFFKGNASVRCELASWFCDIRKRALRH